MRLQPRLAAVFGVLAVVIGLSGVFAAAAATPGFSWQFGALSDLGVGQAAALFNASLIVAGIFGVLFSLGLREGLQLRGRLGTSGATLVALGSISLALEGVFSPDWGAIHTVAAVGFLVLSPLALIAIGKAIIERSKGFGLFWMAAGAAALIIIAALPREGLAIPEILLSFSISAGVIAASWSILSPKR